MNVVCNVNEIGNSRKGTLLGKKGLLAIDLWHGKLRTTIFREASKRERVQQSNSTPKLKLERHDVFANQCNFHKEHMLPNDILKAFSSHFENYIFH